MHSFRRRLSLLATAAVVALLLIAAGCKGFFVNQPTSVTVTPSSQTLASSQQLGFTAQAAFSDNSTKNVTKSATWSTSNPCVVAIISSGANAGNATDVGTGAAATITASFNGVSGTATATVTTGLTITPCAEQVVGTFPEVLYHVGDNVTFTASGATTAVTWTSSNMSVVNIGSSGAATFPAAGTATITANDGTQTGTLFITVQ